MEVIARVDNLCKSFGAVAALKSVSLEIFQGETIALVGENGAGKSTLAKTITGVYTKDSGSIFIDQNEVSIRNTKDAKLLGIAQVYQASELVPEMTVAENIFLGEDLFSQKGLVNQKHLLSEAGKILEEYGIPIQPNIKAKDLSAAFKQYVSIAKVLVHKPRIIIWDEPTAVLSDNEVKMLFRIIRKLKDEKITMIYISHRLEEVFALCERIAVMRDGQLVATLENQDLKKEHLITHMLGRSIKDMYAKKGKPFSDDKILALDNVSTHKVKDIHFHLKHGEILGVAGLVNSGRTELARAIFGVDKLLAGTIYLNGKEVNIKNPHVASKLGLFFAPEDRKKEALVLCRPIRENVSLSNLAKITKFGVCNNKVETRNVALLCKDLNVRTNTIENPVQNLSGGNQQKVVVAKAVTAQPKVLIFDEPTQGIDVGAKAEIYTLFEKLRAEGMSMMIISSEIEELQRLCDRLIIMRNYRISGEVDHESINDTALILNYMYKGDNHEQN